MDSAYSTDLRGSGGLGGCFRLSGIAKMTDSEKAAIIAESDQNRAQERDEELLDVVRATVWQLNVLVDRLEKFVQPPIDDENRG